MLKVRMLRTDYWDNAGRTEMLWGGQEYDLPVEVAKDFCGSGVAYLVGEAVVSNKSLGKVRNTKNVAAKNDKPKAGDRTSGRARKSKRIKNLSAH